MHLSAWRSGIGYSSYRSDNEVTSSAVRGGNGCSQSSRIESLTDEAKEPQDIRFAAVVLAYKDVDARQVLDFDLVRSEASVSRDAETVDHHKVVVSADLARTLPRNPREF